MKNRYKEERLTVGGLLLAIGIVLLICVIGSWDEVEGAELQMSCFTCDGTTVCYTANKQLTTYDAQHEVCKLASPIKVDDWLYDWSNMGEVTVDVRSK
jgi:hypothetical protein